MFRVEAVGIARARLRSLSLAIGLALGLAGVASGPGAAQSLVDEVRIGVLAQNVEGSGVEHGLDLNGEVLFVSPLAPSGDPLRDALLRARPHLGGTWNADGMTSKAYFGLTWKLPLLERVYFESSFGGAVHDGSLDEPGEAQYGCRWNFRESASLGFDVDAKWTVLLTVDHMSNANLCEQNRGLTNAGVRVGYKLN